MRKPTARPSRNNACASALDYSIGDAPAASVRLDVGRPDHLAPLLCFFGDERAELGGRACKYRVAIVRNPRFHRGIGERGADLLVELVDDVGGPVLSCAGPPPPARGAAP